MKQIAISIVMPVYNAGIYLDEALKSIFRQSFQEFELICVDDASCDGITENILRSYQFQSEKMQIIRLEEHVGAGKARNIGFFRAKGEYVIFLDADDLFETDLLKKMYECIKKYQADICLCGYQIFSIDNGVKHFEGFYMPDEYKINCSHREDWLLHISMAAWNKLCRRDFVLGQGIFFQSLTSCNDVFFSCMAMINAKKKCYVEGVPLVLYRSNTKTQISADRDPVNLYRAVMQVYAEMKGEGMLLQQLGALLLWNGFHDIKKSKNEKQSIELYNLTKQFFIDHAINFQNNVLSVCMDNIKNLPYECKWFLGCTDFENQLRLTEEKLRKKIDGKNQVYLWGCGYRGNVFQKFCKARGILLHGVADIRNCHIGEKTDYGNEIVDTESLLKGNGLVIASNREVYEYLQQKGLNVLNLAEYYIG